MLAALLCIVTMALFSLADASASNAAPSGYAHSRDGTVVASESSRDAPSTSIVDWAVADTDHPLEHGQLPIADLGVQPPLVASSKPVLTADGHPDAAENPLPERPPRA